MFVGTFDNKKSYNATIFLKGDKNNNIPNGKKNLLSPKQGPRTETPNTETLKSGTLKTGNVKFLTTHFLVLCLLVNIVLSKREIRQKRVNNILAPSNEKKNNNKNEKRLY